MTIAKLTLLKQSTNSWHLVTRFSHHYLTTIYSSSTEEAIELSRRWMSSFMYTVDIEVEDGSKQHKYSSQEAAVP